MRARGAEILGARQRVGASAPTRTSALGVESLGCGGGGGEGHSVAEALELADKAAGLPLWIEPFLVVVRTEILERLASREQVPDKVKQAVGDRHRGLVRSAPMGDL